ncbi:S-adenosyl-L-methionine-dependent methyltransferase [Cristinia sonorae]|uniref:S-adenosyl-L-methionine-dependent methyltransferase n=1 Tax=Cristinia sonorae TaxID=1940300 RepID=A0A8K0UQC6_9AGAR|nr:S-adenosyl-L-methionine-dependent methyltransferase [Cristinia sonorae]
MSSKSTIHHLSHDGYGGQKSEMYDKYRYGYAPVQLSYMYSALSKKVGLNVVEMGAGTGLFTRALLADPQWNASISEMKCSDPVEGMRGIFTQVIKDPRVTISDGTFEESNVPDAWADVIFSATAFHWCNDLEAAAQEFARILRPGGTIIFVWQMEDRKRWVEEMWQLGMIYQNITGKTMQAFNQWRFHQIFNLPTFKANFHDPKQEDIKYIVQDGLEGVLNRFRTWSAIAALPDDKREEVVLELAQIIEKGEDLEWVGREEGIFKIPMATPTIIIQRR